MICLFLFKTAAEFFHFVNIRFPGIGGCSSLTINYHEGAQGFLYCAAGGHGVLKLDLADTPDFVAGLTIIGK